MLTPDCMLVSRTRVVLRVSESAATGLSCLPFAVLLVFFFLPFFLSRCLYAQAAAMSEKADKEKEAALLEQHRSHAAKMENVEASLRLQHAEALETTMSKSSSEWETEREAIRLALAAEHKQHAASAVAAKEEAHRARLEASLEQSAAEHRASLAEQGAQAEAEHTKALRLQAASLQAAHAKTLEQVQAAKDALHGRILEEALAARDAEHQKVLDAQLRQQEAHHVERTQMLLSQHNESTRSRTEEVLKSKNLDHDAHMIRVKDELAAGAPRAPFANPMSATRKAARRPRRVFSALSLSSAFGCPDVLSPIPIHPRLSLHSLASLSPLLSLAGHRENLSRELAHQREQLRRQAEAEKHDLATRLEAKRVSDLADQAQANDDSVRALTTQLKAAHAAAMTKLEGEWTARREEAVKVSAHNLHDMHQEALRRALFDKDREMQETIERMVNEKDAHHVEIMQQMAAQRDEEAHDRLNAELEAKDAEHQVNEQTRTHACAVRDQRWFACRKDKHKLVREGPVLPECVTK